MAFQDGGLSLVPERVMRRPADCMREGTKLTRAGTSADVALPLPRPPGTDALEHHYFSTLWEPAPDARRLLDRVVPLPEMPRPRSPRASPGGVDQRQLQDRGGRPSSALPMFRPTRDRRRHQTHLHGHVAPLRRSKTDTCCEECQVPTPRHGGSEGTHSPVSYPPSDVFAVLHDLSEGSRDTHASMRALQRLEPADRPASAGPG